MFNAYKCTDNRQIISMIPNFHTHQYCFGNPHFNLLYDHKTTLIGKWIDTCARQNIAVSKIGAPVPRMKQNDPGGAKKRKISEQKGERVENHPKLTFCRYTSSRTTKWSEGISHKLVPHCFFSFSKCSVLGLVSM